MQIPAQPGSCLLLPVRRERRIGHSPLAVASHLRFGKAPLLVQKIYFEEVVKEVVLLKFGIELALVKSYICRSWIIGSYW
jgi:hypothetical protein